MINGLFPMVTIVLSLLIYHRIPSTYNFIGLFLALVAIFLMAFDEVKHGPTAGARRVEYHQSMPTR
jgi:drug/metabolite transporter (DMT)-like permease